MNSRERVLKAFNHEEADKIPTFCQGTMLEFREKCKKMWGNEFKEDNGYILYKSNFNIPKKLGFDSSWGGGILNRPPKEVIDNNPLPKPDVGDENYYIDYNGRIQKLNHMGWDFPYYMGTILKTEDQVDDWYETYFSMTWEEFPNYIENTNRRLRNFKNKDFIVAQGIPAILEPIWEGMGMALFAKILRKKRDKLKKYIGYNTKIAVQAAKIAVETEFEIFFMPDDTAYKNNTMIDPKIHLELIVPAYKEICNVVNKAGKYIIFHSDGYTTPYFDGLVEAGFSGVESLEPVAGNDLKHLKEKYGDKLCLIGNIDVSRLLPYGTKGDVVKAVKKCIKDAGEGGEYVLSLFTDLTNSCKVENVQTMIDAVNKFGKYPLNV